MEIAWEVQYDQGVLPLIMKATLMVRATGSTHNLTEQRILSGGFCRRTRKCKESRTLTNPKGSAPVAKGISHGIGIAPDHKTLWTNSRPANAVFVYSLPDLKLLGHLPEQDSE